MPVDGKSVKENREIEGKTCHNPRTQYSPNIDISNTRIYMHSNGLSIFDEYLLQQHSGDLARIHVGKRHKVPVWPVSGSPAETKPLFFCSPRLDQYEARTRDFGLHSAP